MCFAAMMVAGTGLKAQQITVTLSPGWTWFSYPCAETLDFSTAFGTFMPMEGDCIKSQYGFSEYHSGQWTGSISQFCEGMGYMYHSMRNEAVTFAFGKLVPQVLVTTSEPTDITVTNAMVGGTVTIGEGNHIFARGVCWGMESNPDIDGNHLTGNAVAGSQSFMLNDLTMGTTYYVRAYVATDNGLAYGEEKMFSTKDGIPVLTTAEITGIGMDQATCGGEVIDDGGLEITARGVCWSTSPNPTVADAHTTDGPGMGSFVSTMTGLTPNTTYYVRAYATNSHTTAYGDEVSFTTVPLSFMVTVSANPTMWGSVSGGGVYPDGQSCTLTALPNFGYTFTNWTENGNVVSSDASYTFTVNADRNLDGS